MSESIQHRWDVTVEEAAEIQNRLRTQIIRTNSFEPGEIKTVAGIDASYKEVGQAAVAVFSFPDLKLIDRATATGIVNFPYVPGYLSFREVPLVLEALKQLSIQPDLLMLDGQGYAHPRRFGIACHVGLYLDKPTIGCAKSVLVGSYENLGPNMGDTAPLIHRGEIIGTALRSKPRTNPLIISAGHKIDLTTAVDFVIKCLRGYRLPETTRTADKIAGEAQQTEEDGLTQGKLF